MNAIASSSSIHDQFLHNAPLAIEDDADAIKQYNGMHLVGHSTNCQHHTNPWNNSYAYRLTTPEGLWTRNDESGGR